MSSFDCVIISFVFFLFLKTKSKIKTTFNKAKAPGIFGNFPYSSRKLKLHSGAAGFIYYLQKNVQKKNS